MAVLCRSCSIFHNESKKIEFAFFRFFYDFLRILQDPAPSPRSRRASFTNRPSNFADRTSGQKLDCNWVPGAMAGGGSSIPVREGSARPGKGGGVLRGSPTTDSEGWTAPRACQRGGSVAPASGGRCELAPGEAAARPGQKAALEAPGDPSEGG
jgi:hypothetical protein